MTCGEFFLEDEGSNRTRTLVRKLLNNQAVGRFLATHFADIHAEFTTLMATESL